ncbi:MAG: hypothetical protein JWQ12_460 [Glaciihabitans sp.]|nr:hypothetical protein [Glaciihabitans sp.]
MTRYVALLHGINVGPSSQIAMKDLAAVFEGCGCTSVKTVLRSGNVVFDAPTAPDAAGLEAAIATGTGVKARVLVVTAKRFRDAVEAWPFGEIADDPAKSLVTFVEKMPAASTVSRLSEKELAPEVLELGKHALYQWLPDGVLATKLPAKFVRQFGERATGRNLRTCEKVLALLSDTRTAS